MALYANKIASPAATKLVWPRIHEGRQDFIASVWGRLLAEDIVELGIHLKKNGKEGRKAVPVATQSSYPIIKRLVQVKVDYGY